MNRAEHVAWCKERALAYLDAGETDDAFSSIVSDLTKHPDTQEHAGSELGLMLKLGGHLDTPAEMRKFIEGFN